MNIDQAINNINPELAKELEGQWPDFGEEKPNPAFWIEFVKEIEKGIKDIDNEIACWKERITHNRANVGMRRECKEVLQELVKEREKELWSIKAFTNYGQKLKVSLGRERKLESQNTPQG